MPKTEKEIITTYITKEQKIFLENKSEKTGIPQAELIRRAINNYIVRDNKGGH